MVATLDAFFDGYVEPKKENLKDDQALTSIANSVNMAVPWFLMTTWLYYKRDVSIVSDHVYDRLAHLILDRWEDITHHHKEYIDKDGLSAGSGFSINEFPMITKSAAARLAGEIGEEVFL